MEDIELVLKMRSDFECEIICVALDGHDALPKAPIHQMFDRLHKNIANSTEGSSGRFPKVSCFEFTKLG